MPAAKAAEKTGAMSWWRCYHGAPSDPKWQVVARRLNAGAAGAPVRPGDVWAVASCVYDAASKGKPRGNIERLDLEEVAMVLGYESDLVQRIFDGLRDKNVHDGSNVLAWDERQPTREDPTAAQRKRDQRQRDKKGARTVRTTGAQPPIGPDGHASSHNVTQGHNASRPEERREEDRIEEQNLPPPELVAARATMPEAWPPFGGRKAKSLAKEVFDRLIETHPPTTGDSIADARAEFEKLLAAGELPPPRILIACNVEYAIEMRDLHAQQAAAKQTQQKIVFLVNWLRGRRWEGATLKRAQARVTMENAQSAMIDMLRASLGPIAEDLFREFGSAAALVATMAEADIDPGPPMAVRFHSAFRLSHVQQKHPRLDEISGGLVKWEVRSGAAVIPM
ncbi:MAG: hypothetical protein JWM33_3317, partial [Caulobacteraceae bacterium]|nr:hypothetical protein [Caulobacteraceae bacterium]